MWPIYIRHFCLESSQVDQDASGDLVSREENYIHFPHLPPPSQLIPLTETIVIN